MPESDQADRRATAFWNKVARIAGGFAIGTLLVWASGEPGGISAGILAVAVGTALGIIAFTLDRRS